MRKILLGLHGGASAEGAAHVARLLRERSGAAIEAVAVLEPLPIIDCGYGPVYVPDPATEEELEDQLRAGVEKQLTRCDLGGTNCSVLHGARTASIAGAAAARHADLIVVGIGPHHLTDRALGGETALHLAQHASIPVLAVPAAMRTLPQRILSAVDFSPASLAAARLAATLLTSGDTLELAHVGAAAQIGGIVLGSANTQEASRRMEAFAAEVPLSNGVQCVTRVFGGEPTRTLLQVAMETRADAIALGSHGYNVWQRVLVGSVSSTVLRLAQCAVLIYPARCVAPAVEAEAVAAFAGLTA
jgi:nucleotide-binding universal stress UspA family protein